MPIFAWAMLVFAVMIVIASCSAAEFRSWLILLGELRLFWVARFFLANGLGEFAAQDEAVRLAIAAATVLAVAAEVLPLHQCLRRRDTDFAGWQYRMDAAGAAIGRIATFWQGLPERGAVRTGFVRLIFEQSPLPLRGPGEQVEVGTVIASQPWEGRKIVRAAEHVDAVDLVKLDPIEHAAQMGGSGVRRAASAKACAASAIRRASPRLIVSMGLFGVSSASGEQCA